MHWDGSLPANGRSHARGRGLGSWSSPIGFGRPSASDARGATVEEMRKGNLTRRTSAVRFEPSSQGRLVPGSPERKAAESHSLQRVAFLLSAHRSYRCGIWVLRILLRVGLRRRNRSSTADGLLAMARHGRRATWIQLRFQICGDLCCRRKEPTSTIQLNCSETQFAARFRGIQRRHTGVVQDPADGLGIHHWAVSGLQCFKKVDLHGRAANSGPSWRWWSFARNSVHGRRQKWLRQTHVLLSANPHLSLLARPDSHEIQAWPQNLVATRFMVLTVNQKWGQK